jgi:diaminohydroxyphosphoribosylaminopyrimidine deaminase/5-amino-6-(5-phosphoribosylamino)uracil reductase
MQDHAHWMRRAIRLAMNGRGRVEPNPMVGCVIVKDGRLIGEGYHEQFGGPHAEPNALAACTESPAGATVYVTLEPCCHTNKKTPPCVPRLIEAKVGRVVIGCLDPNPEVNGRGAEQLRAAGVEVVAPVVEKECRQLVAAFIAQTTLKRPYVTLKWAETADSKVAGERERLHISNPQSTALVHQLRARSDAIMVSAKTVIADDPLLTARDVAHARPLLRVVLDRHVHLPLDSRLVQTVGEARVRVYTPPETYSTHRATLVEELLRRGVEVVAMPDMPSILSDLHESGVTHLLVEPGPTLSRGWFREANALDRLWLIRSPRRYGYGGFTAPMVPQNYVSTAELDVAGDKLIEYLNPITLTYSAPVPSADLVLASDAGRSAS